MITIENMFDHVSQIHNFNFSSSEMEMFSRRPTLRHTHTDWSVAPFDSFL